MSHTAEHTASPASSLPTTHHSAPQPPTPTHATTPDDALSSSTLSDGSDHSDGSPVLGSVADDWSAEHSARPPPRVLRAEAVLAHRTSRIRLVLEQMVDSLNHQAVLRTAEALGIQHVYAVDDGTRKEYTIKGGVRVRPTITTGSSRWLTLHSFTDTQSCIDALHADGCTIWATSLSSTAHPLTSHSTPLPLPPLLAIVIGREVDGVSPLFLSASSRHIRLPQFGFTESFNVSVATALVLQRLLDLGGEEVRGEGGMGEEERRRLRRAWYERLAPTVGMRDEYARWVEKGDKGELQWKEEDLRPKEATRVPRVNRRQRQRMIEAGQREVVVHKPHALAAEGAQGGGGRDMAVEEERKTSHPP